MAVVPFLTSFNLGPNWTIMFPFLHLFMCLTNWEGYGSKRPLSILGSDPRIHLDPKRETKKHFGQDNWPPGRESNPDLLPSKPMCWYSNSDVPLYNAKCLLWWTKLYFIPGYMHWNFKRKSTNCSYYI